MEIIFHKDFKKRFAKLPTKIQKQFAFRLEIFLKDTTNPMLHNHSVDKRFTDCRSINITGDYRAILRETDDDVIFIAIGTHSELY